MQRFFLYSVLFISAAFASGAINQFAKWEGEIQKFEAADRTQMPPANAVLFVGSSSIRMWTNLAEAFPNVKTIRRGFGGSQMADATHFADRIVIPYKPRHVLVYEGDNDLAAGKSAEQVVNDFKEFVAKVHAALPKTKISYIAIKPSPSREKFRDKALAVNSAVKKLAHWNPRIEYIDVWNPMLGENGKPRPDIFLADKLHMNATGYEIWRKVISKKID
jgi:lysophospholipase L1-like esterase